MYDPNETPLPGAVPPNVYSRAKIIFAGLVEGDDPRIIADVRFSVNEGDVKNGKVGKRFWIGTKDDPEAEAADARKGFGLAQFKQLCINAGVPFMGADTVREAVRQNCLQLKGAEVGIKVIEDTYTDKNGSEKHSIKVDRTYRAGVSASA